MAAARASEPTKGAHILYLHGFGSSSWGFSAQECPIFIEMQKLLKGTGVTLHAPSYHPEGDVNKTRVNSLLEQIVTQAEQLPDGRFDAVVGCSFGGWMSSLLQERRPDLFSAAVLIAPAIDNYRRNYQGVDSEEWHMRAEFVKELANLPARPVIRVPTLLLHGQLDNDDGGSALWRVKEWVAANSFTGCYFPENVDHSVETWLNQEGVHDAPSFSDMLKWALGTAEVSAQTTSPSMRPCPSFCCGSEMDHQDFDDSRMSLCN